MARGTTCVCHCVAANHGTGRVVRFVRVEGTLRAVLSSIQQASLANARPRLLAQIEAFDAALAKAKATSASIGYGLWRVRRDLARVTGMHSFAGRMKVLATAQKIMDDYIATADRIRKSTEHMQRPEEWDSKLKRAKEEYGLG
jgi:hypothetical protein